jgi:DNA-binding response OmpR family regulator
MSSLQERRQPAGKIMAVDDNPANLKLLEEMLEQRGYRVRSFPRGRLALAAASQDPPDLILLDVSMPELSGYEVCERLKSDAQLSTIPVIFLSALHETEDKVKGFQSGGVDYISKPFQFEEIYARVATHLKLHELQRATKLQNERLEETVNARTRELAEAHRRLAQLDRAKDDFLRIISHELRTPLNGLLGIGEILLEDAGPSAENTELRPLFERAVQRLISLVDDALLLTEIDVKGEKFEISTFSLRSALSGAIAGATAFAAFRGVALPQQPTQAGAVQAPDHLLVRAFQALLETAVKFSKEGETVQLLFQDGLHSFGVVIESRGRAIPCSAIPKFFDVFSISDALTPGGDLGLGPSLACRILALFGGTTAVANRTEPGIRLTVMFNSTSSP